MPLDARDSPSIRRLLLRVPEFRGLFDQFVDEGERGSLWAVNGPRPVTARDVR